MPNKPDKIDEFVGETVIIKPNALLNRGRLFTTQTWTSEQKITNALIGSPRQKEETPSGWIFYTHNKIAFVIGNGNHRAGIACLRKETIPMKIVGIWEKGREEIYGFNIIVRKIRNDLSNAEPALL